MLKFIKHALSKPTHYPERVFTFEASDEDDELRLHIQQDKEEVECHYEEKNENLGQPKLEVAVVEGLRQSTVALRETRIDDVGATGAATVGAPRRAHHILALEAQSSVESDVIAHNDTSLLCGESSQERGSVELTLLYDAPVRSMTIHVLQARSLPQRTPGQILQSQDTSLLCRESSQERGSVELTLLYVAPVRSMTIHVLQARSLPQRTPGQILQSQDTSLLCGESSQERGSVELTLLYDAPVRSMTIHVLQARSLPQRTPGQILQSQVRVVLLPLKKQKFKSKIRNGENPQYMESFVLHKINPEDVHGLGLRIRIYGCERMRRHRLLGEALVSFATLNLELENSLWLQLAPRQHHPTSLQLPKLETSQSITGILASPSSVATVTLGHFGGAGGGEGGSLARSDSASSCCSARSAPELLLGLQYNSVTGHLAVEVIKGTHFRKLSPNKAPDTYVKLVLISSLGMEMGRCKSTTRRAQSNPLYKELFIFQVALFQLTEVTLMVSVWWRRSVKRNEMVGWFSLGHSPSGRDEQRHWQELTERPGEQVQRWHVLLDS
ncbi:c2 domain-containing protein [Phthorimaea operculella]|nr:c2 domain-containing protein [Phthorimaea operculella]